MKKDYVDLDQEVALFRFGVIADLVNLPPETKGLYSKLREKADKDSGLAEKVQTGRL
jgi:hypothetical protein